MKSYQRDVASHNDADSFVMSQRFVGFEPGFNFAGLEGSMPLLCGKAYEFWRKPLIFDVGLMNDVFR